MHQMDSDMEYTPRRCATPMRPVAVKACSDDIEGRDRLTQNEAFSDSGMLRRITQKRPRGMRVS